MNDSDVFLGIKRDEGTPVWWLKDLDPCGECPKGTCDRCEVCVWATMTNLVADEPDPVWQLTEAPIS